MQTFKRTFEIDGHKYEFIAEVGGSVEFHLVTHSTDFFTWDDVEAIADKAIHKSAFKVLREVKKLFEEWVHTHKPYYFYFVASTERKREVYQWFVRKLPESITEKYFIDGLTSIAFIRKCDA